MRNKKRFAAILAVLMTASTLLSTACKKDDTKGNEEAELSPVVSYSFDETSGNTTKESVSGKEYKIEYVFNAENREYRGKLCIWTAFQTPLRIRIS